MLNTNDYLLDITDFFWANLLEKWSWLLPNEFIIWFANRFSDLFFIFKDNTVHHLLTDKGELKHVADSREQFANLLDENNHANHWLLIPLVDKLRAIDLKLQIGQCFGYKLLPILGGSYSLDNIAVKSVGEYYAFLGDIYKQIRDLPDGTKIEFKIT